MKNKKNLAPLYLSLRIYCSFVRLSKWGFSCVDHLGVEALYFYPERKARIFGNHGVCIASNYVHSETFE